MKIMTILMKSVMKKILKAAGLANEASSNNGNDPISEEEMKI